MQITEIKKGKYRHFKGNIYELENIAEHTETGESMAIYRDRNDNGMLYARPLDMFLSEVDKEKYPDAIQKYRFQYIGEGTDYMCIDCETDDGVEHNCVKGNEEQ